MSGKELKMRLHFSIIFSIATLLAICAFGQIQGKSPSIPPQYQSSIRKGWAEYDRISQGMNALRVEVKLERSVYLPGEAICAQLVVSNPTAAPIAAFPPFGTGHRSSLMLQILKSADEWTRYGEGEEMFSDDYTDGDMMAHRKIIWIGASQSLTAKVCMHGTTSQVLIPHPEVRRLPPAKFRLGLAYEKQADGEFEIQPVLGSSGFATVVLPEYESTRDPRDGIPTNCLGVGVAALRTHEGTVIVSYLRLDSCWASDYENGLADAFAGFTRVAETTKSVKNLAISRLSDGRIQITWREGEDNQQRKVILPRVNGKRESEDDDNHNDDHN